MKELINKVQSRMRGSERVYFAMEVDRLAVNGSAKQRACLAIVANLQKGSQEDAVYVFDWHRTRKPKLRFTIPVLRDFNLLTQTEKLGQRSGRIAIPLAEGGMVAVLVRDESNLSSFERLIEIARENAEMCGYQKGGMSHLWLREYDAKPTEPDDDENDMDAFETYEDSWSASGVGMAASGLTPDAMIEHDWINQTLRGRIDEYTVTKPIKVVCGTWNVCEKLPQDDLTDWLNTYENKDADIYAIGLQEVDMSAGSLFGSSDSLGYWHPCIGRTLGHMGRYVRVRHQQLVGCLIMVYVKAHVAEHVRDVADTWVGVGLMNMMGNKGGVAVRFRLHDTSFLFINSHLAAHQDMVERRNQDFDQIQRRLVLPPLAPSVPHETASLDKTTIHDYDRVVWMGDLNYRIDLSNKKTRTLIDGSDWSDLYCSDQLMKERAKGRVFNGFKEEEITFPPTYKFDFGTDMYDTSEKQRIPAWTDRVLYKPEGISCSNYTSHPTIMISDHKPVSAVLSVDVNIVDEAKLETVYQNVLRDNDRLKNIALPDATVDTNMVEFGDLRYMEAIKHQVKLTNVGYDTVRWCFVARSKDSADEQSRKSQKFHDSWLVVSPLRGSLAPGESCEFTIEANVGPNTAHRHNMTPHKNETSVQLEDILVLHLERGKDLFIVTTGEYQLSPYGMKLSDLIENTQPIRPSATYLKQRATQEAGEEKGVKQIVPYELKRLVEYLVLKCSDEPNILLEEGVPTEQAAIRECLATGEEFPSNASPHSFASCLLDLCASFEDSVIPKTFTRMAVSAASAEVNQVLMVIETLPAQNYNVLMYVLNFGLDLLKESDVNHLQYESVASLFADVLLDTELFTLEGMGSKKGRYLFMYNALTETARANSP